jgi:hypothetical protein
LADGQVKFTASGYAPLSVATEFRVTWGTKVIFTPTFKVTVNSGGGSCSMTSDSVKTAAIDDKTTTVDYIMPATDLWNGSY